MGTKKNDILYLKYLISNTIRSLKDMGEIVETQDEVYELEDALELINKLIK
jgi:hypothetical protein